MRSLVAYKQNLKFERRKERSVNKFFAEAGDIYLNRHNVEIAWLWKDAVYTGADWPGFTSKSIYLEIGVELDNYAAFARLFGVMGRAKSAIDNITPQKLLQLFQVGKAEVFCCVNAECDYSLSFKKTLKIMRATDEWNNEHTVHQTLIFPEQFINYTKRHYLMRD